MRLVIHLTLHFIAPGIAARLLRPKQWLRTWLVMLSAMLIDQDHLVATPIFDPNRCSVGFHPLHTYPAIALYALMALFPRSRLLGIGLLIHIALDGLDCLWMAI